MRPDWEVKTSSDAVKFLSRAFRHQRQREDRPLAVNETLTILVDAQCACLTASYGETARVQEMAWTGSKWDERGAA